MVGQTGVTVYACVPTHPLASVARTVNVAVVTLFGVPVRAPVEVLKVAQDGMAPTVMAYTYGVAPPVPVASDDTGSAGFGQDVVFSPWANDTAMGSATTGSVTYTDAGFDHFSVLLCAVGEIGRAHV